MNRSAEPTIKALHDAAMEMYDQATTAILRRDLDGHTAFLCRALTLEQQACRLAKERIPDTFTERVLRKSVRNLKRAIYIHHIAKRRAYSADRASVLHKGESL